MIRQRRASPAKGRKTEGYPLRLIKIILTTFVLTNRFLFGKVVGQHLLIHHKHPDIMSTQKVIIGTLSGLLAGVTLGLLFAPATGSETRQKISYNADALKRRFRRITGSAHHELEDVTDIFASEVAGLKEDARDRILQILRAAKNSANNIKESAHS